MNATVPHAKIDDAALAGGIDAGAAALGIDVSGNQVEALVAYIRLIERWNATYNLTAIRDPRDMVASHILDCLAAAQAMTRRLGDGARQILDVGSGAGLPGIVIAVFEPEAEVLCVDSVGKKAAFITHAAASLGLKNVAAHHGRVEAMKERRFDIVASRAFASLAQFVSSTAHLLDGRGVWMALKGKPASDEIEELGRIGFHVERLSVPHLSGERCIVWLWPDVAEASARF